MAEPTVIASRHPYRYDKHALKLIENSPTRLQCCAMEGHWPAEGGRATVKVVSIVEGAPLKQTNCLLTEHHVKLCYYSVPLPESIHYSPT